MDELGCSRWKIRGCSMIKTRPARGHGGDFGMKRSLGVRGNVWEEGQGAGVGIWEFGAAGRWEKKEFRGWIKVEFVQHSEWRGQHWEKWDWGLPFKKGRDVPGFQSIPDSLGSSSLSVLDPGRIFPVPGLQSQPISAGSAFPEPDSISPVPQAPTQTWEKQRKPGNSGTSHGLGRSGGIISRWEENTRTPTLQWLQARKNFPSWIIFPASKSQCSAQIQGKAEMPE